jgi:hypothetical protein
LVVVGVPSINSACDKPNAVASVGRIDRRRRYNHGRDFVTRKFQIRMHLVEYNSPVPISKPKNIFPHDVARGNLAYCSKHFGPKMAFIFFAFSFSC